MTEVVNTKKKHTRVFKCLLPDQEEPKGNYNGDSPYQAANKALSRLFRDKFQKDQCLDVEIRFLVVDISKNSNKKMHEYTGRRVKLEEPVKYIVGENHEIVKEYKNILRKVKKPKKVVN